MYFFGNSCLFRCFYLRRYKNNKYEFKYYYLIEEKEIFRIFFIKMINTFYNIFVKI